MEGKMQKEKAVGIIGCVFVLMTMLLSGCDTITPYSPPKPPLLPGQVDQPFSIHVDSLVARDADLKAKTYIIASAMKNVDDGDIQFKEFARYVENALALKGYIRKNNKEGADLLISLAYWIGEPQTTTSTETYTSGVGYSYPVGWMWYTVPPQIRQETTTNTTYKETLVLEAYDLKDTSKRSQLWKTTMENVVYENNIENDIGDLRLVLPYMIKAGMKYFGVDSREKKYEWVEGRDPMVLEIRK